MTIERYSFKEGITAGESAEEILKNNRSKAESLPEGEYDLTPENGVKHYIKHELTVWADGTGVYTMSPTDGPWHMGGTRYYLPSDQKIIAITGVIPSTKVNGVFEIIRHVPGPSPKK